MPPQATPLAPPAPKPGKHAKKRIEKAAQNTSTLQLMPPVKTAPEPPPRQAAPTPTPPPSSSSSVAPSSKPHPPSQKPRKLTEMEKKKEALERQNLRAVTQLLAKQKQGRIAPVSSSSSSNTGDADLALALKQSSEEAVRRRQEEEEDQAVEQAKALSRLDDQRRRPLARIQPEDLDDESALKQTMALSMNSFVAEQTRVEATIHAQLPRRTLAFPQGIQTLFRYPAHTISSPSSPWNTVPRRSASSKTLAKGKAKMTPRQAYEEWKDFFLYSKKMKADLGVYSKADKQEEMDVQMFGELGLSPAEQAAKLAPHQKQQRQHDRDQVWKTRGPSTSAFWKD